jgi:DNA-binding MarR family transcriptional regulator
MLDRLVERDFVCRERREGDRRTVYVGITPTGMELLDTLAEEVRSCHTRQLGHLDPEELRTLTRLLRKAREPFEPVDNPWGYSSESVRSPHPTPDPEP